MLSGVGKIVFFVILGGRNGVAVRHDGFGKNHAAGFGGDGERREELKYRVAGKAVALVGRLRSAGGDGKQHGFARKLCA